MKRLYKIAFGVMAMVSAVACGGEVDAVRETWGSAECYEDFWFKKYEPVMMERELEIELNPDACKMFQKCGSVTFYISESNERFVAPEGVDLYYEGEKREDYHFDVDLSDIRDNGTTQHLYLNIGLQFTDATDIEECILYFGVDPKDMKYASSVKVEEGVSHPVKVDDLNVEFISIATDGIVLEKEVVWNPLKKWLVVAAAIIFGVLFLSIIFSRLLTPTVKVSRIAITGAYHKQLTVRGYSMVVLTSKRMKQGFLNKLYKGRILYEVNPTWHSDVTISPRNNKSVTMRYDASSYSCDSRVLEKGGNYTLNDLKERTKIEIRVI